MVARFNLAKQGWRHFKKVKPCKGDLRWVGMDVRWEMYVTLGGCDVKRGPWVSCGLGVAFFGFLVYKYR